ncbi:cell division protein ZapE [Pseudomonas sp. S1Bt30]|uniref:Cell division protein ZapE n=1 Tax=Pseudomonas quebecensis TaxID=2995174 RepID=A0ABY6QKT2_9PSED|nr:MULTISPECIES: cell division protein ZapE [Pseudomonas]MCX4065550.1 cell division protein ZapE [Pseudomonas quebecensis]UZW20449.1 cell division protein ZapE [Pseudomonas quebecensis]UZW22132.1 cell division protein ZapE [Pseudomonas quebecensis]UZW27193.1 cell division protein ZapE [Pseudomonas quebecensis]
MAVPTLIRRLLGKHRSPRNDACIAQFFAQKAQQQGYTLSAGQTRAIAAMARETAHLLAGHATRSLYLHGPVGRGKSWLLDGFFQALPLAEKQRVHFHDFFARLHQGMFQHREQHDALGATLDNLLADCRVLCFDEFHVHDIGDAMLISRLFKALFQRGMLVLVTSNYPPEGLLPNPLYHQRFKPVIDLIAARMDVLEVSSPQDFRSLPQAHATQRFTAGRYVWPGTAAQRAALDLPVTQGPAQHLQVGNRQLLCRHHQARTIAFTFADLCEELTAVMDYLLLCEAFDHWIIDGLPRLAQCPIAVQQRFINLVDVLYDRDKHLILIGNEPLADCLAGQAIDLARTASRLSQLQQTDPQPLPDPVS